MNRDLGVWTSEDSALMLIDYQPEQFESIRSDTPQELIELNTRWLARAAKAFGVPIVDPRPRKALPVSAAAS